MFDLARTIPPPDGKIPYIHLDSGTYPFPQNPTAMLPKSGSGCVRMLQSAVHGVHPLARYAMTCVEQMAPRLSSQTETKMDPALSPAAPSA